MYKWVSSREELNNFYPLIKNFYHISSDFHGDCDDYYNNALYNIEHFNRNILVVYNQNKAVPFVECIPLINHNILVTPLELTFEKTEDFFVPFDEVELRHTRIHVQLELNDFDYFLNTNRLGRYYKKILGTNIRFKVASKKEHIEANKELFPYWKAYWENKIGIVNLSDPLSLKFNRGSTISSFRYSPQEDIALENLFKNNWVSFVAYDKEIPIALATMQVSEDKKSLRWVITRRNTNEKYNNLRLGHCILMFAMDWAIVEGINVFDFGIEMEYKNIWKPSSKDCINEFKKIHHLNYICKKDSIYV